VQLNAKFQIAMLR